MTRLLAVVVVVAAPALARADANAWFDAKQGCGALGAYAKTGRASDLPGCTKIPKDAPQAEVALREAKLAVVEAEEQLGKGHLEKVDAALTELEARLGKAPPAHPELPDRWEQAERLYRQEIAELRNRRKLAPHLERVRASYAAALEADRTKNKKDVEGGPAEAVKAAAACAQTFAELKQTGVDAATQIELAKKEAPRSLKDAADECERVRKAGDALVREQEKALKAKRAQWRAALKGARRKTFDAHPTTLPSFDGAKDAWQKIATCAEWRYTTASGVEVYKWKGAKLLERSIEKK